MFDNEQRKSLFSLKLINLKYIWEEILAYLKEWKKEIPELPEMIFDLNAESSFKEIKDLNPTYFRKIFNNDEVFTEIILALLPQKKTLNLLLKYFEE